MKRRDLIKTITRMAREAGLVAEYIEGASHTKVTLGKKHTVIPRHREINDITAHNILRQLSQD